MPVATAGLVIVFGGFSLGVLGTGAVGRVWHVERFFFHVFYLGFPLALLLFGAASWRAAPVPRLVGVLLIATSVPLFVNFVYEFRIWVFEAGGSAEWIGMASFGLVPLTALVIGYVFHTSVQITARTDAELEIGA